jgi:membrane-associated PAP2 superfamily phosphatase
MPLLAPDRRTVDAAGSPGRRDLGVTVAMLALVLAWDFSGLDVHVVRLFGGPHGFAAHDSLWASTIIHSGGRSLAWALAAVLLVVALRTPKIVGSAPDRAERLAWLGVMLLCSLAVPALKRFSATSCPWDLAEFGGVARYVSHWQWGVSDGGPGHCFPAGHPVAAYAFFGMYFLWRRHDASRARTWLLGVLAAGVVLGVGQLARGAHYPSHTLWSAWICWVICVGAEGLRRGVTLLRSRAARLHRQPMPPL